MLVRFQEDPVRPLRAVALAAPSTSRIDPPIRSAIAGTPPLNSLQFAGAASRGVLQDSSSRLGGQTIRWRPRPARTNLRRTSSRRNRSLAGDCWWRLVSTVRNSPPRPKRSPIRSCSRQLSAPLGLSPQMGTPRCTFQFASGRQHCLATRRMGSLPLARRHVERLRQTSRPSTSSGRIFGAERASGTACADTSRHLSRRLDVDWRFHAQCLARFLSSSIGLPVSRGTVARRKPVLAAGEVSEWLPFSDAPAKRRRRGHRAPNSF